MRFLCDVVDAKSSWGTERFLVVPVNGDGEAWVAAERTELVPRKESV